MVSISESLVVFIRLKSGLPGLELRSGASPGSFPTGGGGQALSETWSKLSSCKEIRQDPKREAECCSEPAGKREGVWLFCPEECFSCFCGHFLRLDKWRSAVKMEDISFHCCEEFHSALPLLETYWSICWKFPVGSVTG